MDGGTYQEVLNKAQELSVDEQYKLLQHLLIILGEHLDIGKLRSILELQGLGKEIWAGIDAQQYVNQERESWNG